MRVQRAYALGDRKVELIKVHIVAPPGKGLAVGSETPPP